MQRSGWEEHVAQGWECKKNRAPGQLRKLAFYANTENGFSAFKLLCRRQSRLLSLQLGVLAFKTDFNNLPGFLLVQLTTRLSMFTNCCSNTQKTKHCWNLMNVVWECFSWLHSQRWSVPTPALKPRGGCSALAGWSACLHKTQELFMRHKQAEPDYNMAYFSQDWLQLGVQHLAEQMPIDQWTTAKHLCWNINESDVEQEQPTHRQYQNMQKLQFGVWARSLLPGEQTGSDCWYSSHQLFLSSVSNSQKKKKNLCWLSQNIFFHSIHSFE